MEGGRERQIERAVQHFMAASRLRQRLRDEPTLRGLERRVRVHIAAAATIANELGAGAGRIGQASAAA